MGNNIQVVDNFLSEYDYQNIYDTVMDHHFSWHYCDNIVPGRFNESTSINPIANFQFYHAAYVAPTSFSKHINTVEPILNKLDILCLYRVKFNMKPYLNGPQYEHGFHIDWPDEAVGLPIKTAVYYVNDNNGYTIFESGEKVESKANRIVIFDGGLEHSGSTCNDQSVRVVLNLNYIGYP